MRRKEKKEHIYSANKKKGHLNAFHTALREHGIESFDYKVLYRIETEDREMLQKELDSKEAYYIRKYKSCLTEYGYNETIDGQYKKGIFNDSLNENKRLKIVPVKNDKKEDELSLEQQSILEQIRKLCEGLGVPMPSVEWTNSIR